MPLSPTEIRFVLKLVCNKGMRRRTDIWRRTNSAETAADYQQAIWTFKEKAIYWRATNTTCLAGALLHNNECNNMVVMHRTLPSAKQFAGVAHINKASALDWKTCDCWSICKCLNKPLIDKSRSPVWACCCWETPGEDSSSKTAALLSSRIRHRLISTSVSASQCLTERFHHFHLVSWGELVLDRNLWLCLLFPPVRTRRPPFLQARLGRLIK